MAVSGKHVTDNLVNHYGVNWEQIILSLVARIYAKQRTHVCGGIVY